MLVEEHRPGISEPVANFASVRLPILTGVFYHFSLYSMHV